MYGLELIVGNKEIFIRTDRTKKTEKLASDILRKLLLPDSPSHRKEVLYFLKRAECELHNLPDGRSYYEIKSNNSTQLVFNGEEPGVMIIDL
jgi:hypothetical protein